MRVLVRESIAEAGVELLRSKFDVDDDEATPLEEIIDRYDAIVIRSATKLTADLIERATNLKMIGRAGVGVDNVDVEAATRRGIVVANAPESTVVSAAEQTVGLMVALARNIPQAHAALKQGRWERSKWGGVELEGKTLGVLGFGRIGQQVARRAVGLGMQVVAYDPFVADERFRELGVEHADDRGRRARRGRLPHAALAADRRDARDDQPRDDRADEGRRQDRQRRPRCARSTRRRSPRRSTPASWQALRSTSSPREPYDGPLLGLDTVVVTPHLAASTDEAQDRAGVIIAEQVVAALEGGLVSNAVNIPVVDKADLEVLGPFIPLAAKLGRLAVELAGGRPRRIVVAAHGPLSDYDTRLLTVAALNGIFQGRVDQVVNYVNASLLAAERGITVSEERLRASRDYMNIVEVRVTPEGGEEVEVSGHDDRAGAAAVPRERLRLRDRHRARAGHGLLPLRRHPGRDRQGRHAVRRERRQHREHGGVADT